ncbi:MAG: hypothetical protein CMB81_00160, partial [Flammeovirgaceae bacterium]|nr:hypothetical protein [Flammeovirgaceae bacterium]
VESNSIYIGNDPSSTTSTAENNVAVGTTALDAITTGDYNTAVGYNALTANTTGSSNLAFGREALYANTTGTGNSASGDRALYSNTTGSYNSASGYWALYANTTGSYNTASGTGALYSNTTGNSNLALGRSALYFNTTGDNNTASGHYALRLNATGSNNTTLGYQAGDVITTGSNNVIIGYDADPSANSATNQIVIGYNATGTGDNEIALGNTSITAIKAQVTSITGYSDERIKREISDNTLGLEFIKKLRPVRYKLKNPADYPAEILEDRFSAIPGSGPGNVGYIRPQDDENYYDGLIAQEVKSAMDEVGIDWSGWSEDIDNGKQGLQYGALTVPLIKAVQEQQDMIESQREMIDLLIEEVKNLKSRIDD